MSSGWDNAEYTDSSTADVHLLELARVTEQHPDRRAVLYIKSEERCCRNAAGPVLWDAKDARGLDSNLTASTSKSGLNRVGDPSRRFLKLNSTLYAKSRQ